MILPEWSSLGLFAVAALVLLLTPGPAVLYIVTRSIDQGKRAGLVSVVGVHVGTLAHIFAAAAGLSALLAASATAFSAVKYLGAAYLIYIGVRRLGDRSSIVAPEAGKPKELRRAFLDGVIVNVLNPSPGARGRAGHRARGGVRAARRDHRLALRDDRGLRRPVAARPAALSDRRALDHRRSLHQPRRGRGALEQPPEIATAGAAATVGARPAALTPPDAPRDPILVVRTRTLHVGASHVRCRIGETRARSRRAGPVPARDREESST